MSETEHEATIGETSDVQRVLRSAARIPRLKAKIAKCIARGDESGKAGAEAELDRRIGELKRIRDAMATVDVELD